MCVLRCVCIWEWLCEYVYACVSVLLSVSVWVCTFVCVLRRVTMCAHVCMHVCVWVYKSSLSLLFSPKILWYYLSQSILTYFSDDKTTLPLPASWELCKEQLFVCKNRTQKSHCLRLIQDYLALQGPVALEISGAWSTAWNNILLPNSYKIT